MKELKKNFIFVQCSIKGEVTCSKSPQILLKDILFQIRFFLDSETSRRSISVAQPMETLTIHP